MKKSAGGKGGGRPSPGIPPTTHIVLLSRWRPQGSLTSQAGRPSATRRHRVQISASADTVTIFPQIASAVTESQAGSSYGDAARPCRFRYAAPKCASSTVTSPSGASPQPFSVQRPSLPPSELIGEADSLQAAPLVKGPENCKEAGNSAPRTRKRRAPKATSVRRHIVMIFHAVRIEGHFIFVVT